MKKTVLSLVFLCVVFCSVASVYAQVAVTYPYSSERPLTIKPGEEVVAYVTLLNVVPGSSDTTVQVAVSGDEELEVALADGVSEYFVPFGERADVAVRVRMPDDASFESQYTVNFLTSEVPSEEGDEVIAFTQGIEISFPVVADIVSASPVPVTISNQQFKDVTRSGQIFSPTTLWFVLISLLGGSFVAVVYVLVRSTRKRRGSKSISLARFSDGSV